MRGSPGFAGSLFVFAEDEKDDVGFFSDLHRFRDAFGVKNWIAENHFVCVPISRGFGDFHAFGVENFGRASNFLLNALENAYAAAGIVAIATEMEVGGIWTDDSNVFVGVL